MRRSRFKLKPCTLIAASVSLIFMQAAALANPTGPQVVNGAVSFQQPNVSTLNITNSPGSIINWQGFSIGSSEVTRFLQQSASSAVLNRVVGSNLSQIYGQLLSNGRVFLINPGGIVVGPGAIVDTAGFVASTLNMLDSDFLAGKLRFQSDTASGPIINQGWIRTGYGGQVILVAPQIENSGLIQTPGGELILAAGQKLTISSLDLEGVQFEVQAPSDTVVNVGKLLADGGAVGVFAGTLRHSGEIRANALVYDEAGRVVLKAQNELQLTSGSTTSADGKTGGSVTVQASAGLARVAGTISAKGSEGKGGDIRVLGNQVAVVENAVIDASGSAGGGQILAGGDFQGGNPGIQNSISTFVGSSATLKADAAQSGDGGRIVVWSDGKTQFYGNLSARGGPDGGNGGFAEVSGKQDLIFAGGANLGAPKGNLGNLLLDPLDLFVFTGGGVLYDAVNDLIEFPSNAATVSPATLAAVTGNVSLNASRYMRIGNDISLSPSYSLTATVGTYTPPALPDPLALSTSVPNQMDLGASITTNGGAVLLSAPTIQYVATSPISIATNGGAITLTATNGSISAYALSLAAGSGPVTATATANTSSSIQLDTVSGGSFTATAQNYIDTSGITTAGGLVSLTSTTSYVSTGNIGTGGGSVMLSAGYFIDTGDITTSGGAVTLTATNYQVNTGNISAGGGNVKLSGTSVYTDVIDTTGGVILSATNGSIGSTVNSASSVSATATSSSYVNVDIASATSLNATSISATNTGCFYGCSASVNLEATGTINVGTVKATAPASVYQYQSAGPGFYNSRNESVSITSFQGSILATSGTSKVQATDVSLVTTAGTGGGIGSNATPLTVEVGRRMELRPNGEFNIALGGLGINQLDVQMGVAQSGSYTGTISGGGVTLNASADTSTVTVTNLSIPGGFNDYIYGSAPSISFYAPNGKLTLNTNPVVVPEGDTREPDVGYPYFSPAPLDVSVRASGDLTLSSSYTRQSSLASLAKFTEFRSDTGTVTLSGTVSANKDTVDITAAGNIVVTDLSTAGNVSVTSFGGDITVGSIVTTSGIGDVSLSVPLSANAVKAQTNSAALEVDAGGSVIVSGKTIGNSAFVTSVDHPLDLKGSSISLTSQNSGGQIGFAVAPVIADTQDLIITATSPTAFNVAAGAKFNVSTGTTALQNLTVLANPGGVGGGPAQVTTEGGLTTYAFASDGTNFSFTPGTVPVTQFVGGTLSFASNSGDITLGNTRIDNGKLSVTAHAGSILAPISAAATLDATEITLNAGTAVGGAADVSITTGDIGSFVRPGTLTITAGRNNSFGSSRNGMVTTGDIEAGDVTITTYGGISLEAITIGNIGTATRAGSVALYANNLSPFAGNAGEIAAGNIKAASIQIQSDYYSTTPVSTGNLDATGSVSILADSSITTGAVDALGVTMSCTYSCYPDITTGAIGSGAVKPTTVTMNGAAVTIGGNVTANPAAVDTVNIHAFSTTPPVSTSSLTISGGNITGGTGSTINLTSSGGTVFQFAKIDAGATGTVTITSPNGIQQTSADSVSAGATCSSGPCNGITAQTVTLDSSSGNIDQSTGDTLLDLFGVTNLTVSAGANVNLDAHSSTLSSLTVVKTDCFDCSGFILSNLGSSQTVVLSDTPGITVNSPSTPLNFDFTYTAGDVVLAGSGITTSGGNVAISASGAFDGTTGGITTAGGNVGVQAFGGTAFAPGITTGMINASGGANIGTIIITNRTIGVTPGGDIEVSGNLTAGSSGSITLTTSDGAIKGSGIISAGNSVTASAFNGDLGTAGNHLAITALTADLTSVLSTGGGGVFATLTGTSSLTMRADDRFNVSSTVALTTLDLETKGSGTGTPGANTLNLSVIGNPQTFTFGRPAAGTFEVLAASGTPVTNATFSASDGDLLVKGGSTLNATSLTLKTLSATGNLRLDGTAAALTLSNTSQDFSAGQDLLISGVANIVATGAQTLAAGRHVTVQAQGGSITLDADTQTIQSTTGTISFTGGASANEKVTVSATGAQTIETFQYAGGDITLQAGDGDGASVTVSGGTGLQKIQAYGNVNVLGSALPASTGSFAEITTAGGDQIVRANGNINVTGGMGTNAFARIRNTGPGNQQVGESWYCCSGFFTDNVTVQGGGGSGSFAEIIAAGPQQILSYLGTVTVAGGMGPNAYARIKTTSTDSSNAQWIGHPYYYDYYPYYGYPISTLNIQGGGGTGSFAEVSAAGFQRVTATTAINLTGNTVADSSASLIGAGQRIAYGDVTLNAGSGNGANVLINSSSSQTIDPGNLTLSGGGGIGATATAQILAAGTQTIDFANSVGLMGGAGPDSFAKISTTGDQTVRAGSISLGGSSGSNSFAEISTSGNNQNIISFGFLTLQGGTQTGAYAKIGMTGTASPTQRVQGFGAVTLTAGNVANTGAIIEGNHQEITTGALTLTGGTGASGNVSDAVIRNLMLHQEITSASIALIGGTDFSTTGLLNLGSEHQTLDVTGTISLNSIAGATANAPVLIQNVPATLQSIDARSISVQTASGSAASAQVFSGGNQWIHTNNPTLTGSSVLVAAGGTGTASIEATASQLLEIDYPQLMQGVVRNGNLTIGDSAGLGTSRIQAADQNIFAGAITIQGPAGDNMKSELKASGAQVITTLQGGIDVFGGSGDNTIAQIDPTTQTILTNGTISVEGGSGINSIAQIVAATGTTTNGQTILVTNGDISLTGGNNSGAAAFITNTGTSSFVGASGGISLIAGSAPGADAIISVGNGPGVLTFSCGGIVGSCTFPSLGPSPTAGILANQPSGSFDTTSLTLPLQQDVSGALIEITLAGATEEPIFGRRVPVCR